MGSQSGSLSAEGPRAIAPETSYSFGTIRQGTVVEHAFTLKNEGAETLRILGARMTTPLLIDRMPARLMPGAELTVRARLDTSKLSGPFKGEILLSLNDPAVPEMMLSFEGRIIPPIEFAPRPVFFVAGIRGEHREDSIEIINHESEPLRIESVENPQERFTTRLETLEEGRRYRLSLMLNPNGPGGKKSETITIRTSNPDKPVLKIGANTYLRERVYTFPDEVDLGTIRMADIKAHPQLLRYTAQTLMVYQVGGSDFQVKIRTDLPMLDLKSERGPKGDRYQNTITLIGDRIKPGRIEGAIDIETNDPEFPSLAVPVRGEIR
jgi:hypothetical protein